MYLWCTFLPSYFQCKLMANGIHFAFKIVEQKKNAHIHNFFRKKMIIYTFPKNKKCIIYNFFTKWDSFFVQNGGTKEKCAFTHFFHKTKCSTISKKKIAMKNDGCAFTQIIRKKNATKNMMADPIHNFSQRKNWSNTQFKTTKNQRKMMADQIHKVKIQMQN